MIKTTHHHAPWASKMIQVPLDPFRRPCRLVRIIQTNLLRPHERPVLPRCDQRLDGLEYLVVVNPGEDLPVLPIERGHINVDVEIETV